MTQTPHSSTISSADLRASLDLVEIKPGVKFSLGTLRDLLPDVETILFFGKVYGLDAKQLGQLLLKVLRTDLASALFGEGGTHSNELQGYLLDGYTDEDGCYHAPIIGPADDGEVNLSPDVPKGEILPEVWKSLEVEVASSIKAVADKLGSVVGLLPGKQGSMVFKSMAVMNAKRPTIGDYKAGIVHARQQENLVILDVSGSMNANTVSRIVGDVVALSYNANAHMAIVSDSVTYWAPGTYGVAEILAAATYGGTHYETLKPLFDRQDWGTVITVADYDSFVDARHIIASASGRVEQVLDISLVNRPTFLAECVGQIAKEVKPLLIASSGRILC